MARKLDLAAHFSEALDIVSPAVNLHHRRVCYIALMIARQLKLDREQMVNLAIAALMHDCGALSKQEREDLLLFEFPYVHRHAFRGYKLIRQFNLFRPAAKIVRFHHVRWDQNDSFADPSVVIPFESHIIHLADRLSILIKPHTNILQQARLLKERMHGFSGSMFCPEIVKAFIIVSRSESFWLDYLSYPDRPVDKLRNDSNEHLLSSDDMIGFAKLFCRIIDFRSHFTATHSDGLAHISSTIAQLLGFPEDRVKDMRIAGYLHDLGKLAVSSEILEKPGQLNTLERFIIKSHTFYTYRILEYIPELDLINRWAAFHHERLDGKGYPFRLGSGDLELGSRIMAVADIFTAITEDRPYREGMDQDKAMSVLRNMATNNAIDSHIVDLVGMHFDEINEIRRVSQLEAENEHQDFLSFEGAKSK